MFENIFTAVFAIEMVSTLVASKGFLARDMTYISVQRYSVTFCATVLSSSKSSSCKWATSGMYWTQWAALLAVLNARPRN